MDPQKSINLSLQILKENEAYLCHLIERNADAIIIVDKEGIIRFANPAAEELFSREAEKLIGESFRYPLRSDETSEIQIVVNNKEMRIAEMKAVEIQWTGEVHYLASIRDITKHKRTEENLRESEEKFRKISAAAKDAIVILDNNGNILYWNKAADNMFGYTEDEAYGNNLYKMIVPEQVYQTRVKEFRRFKEKGRCAAMRKNLELEVKKKDGTIFPIEFSLSGVQIEDKWSVIGIVRDITKRKQAEEKIKRDFHIQSAINSMLRISLEPIPLQQQLQRILDLILSIPWLSLQSKGCIYLVEENPEVLVMTCQRHLSESLLKRCKKVPFGRCLCGRAASGREMIFADHIDARHETHYKGMLSHGHYCVPICLATHVLGVINLYIKKGHKQSQEEMDFLLTVANTLAGIIERKRSEEALQKAKEELDLRVKERTAELTEAVEQLEREITERKRAQEELKKSEDRYRTLVEHVPVITYTAALDELSTTLYISPQVESILGFTRKEWKNNPNIWDRQIHPADRERVLEEVSTAHKRDKSFMSEYRMMTKNGQTVWFRDEAVIVRNEAGFPLFLQGMMLDISDRKKAEEVMNKQREKFISVLIHDLKGPLIPILGFSKRLLEGKPKSEEENITLIHEIHDSSKDLLNVIEKTSQSLRRKAALSAFNPKKVEFNAIFLKVVTNCLSEIDNKGIDISINNKTRDSWNQLKKIEIEADPYQLRTLIENLLGNAIKYARKSIKIKLKKTSSGLQFVISDDGPGVPEEYQEKIFEEYFQIPRSKKGTGIGLYSVKKVVENHRGNVVVHSILNQGVTFEVTLPR